MAEGEVGGLHEDLDNAEKTIAALNNNLGKQQKGIQELQLALEVRNIRSNKLSFTLPPLVKVTISPAPSPS